MIELIVKIFAALNSNKHPGEIAHAICCGFLLGLMPKNNVLWYIVFVFVMFLRINKGFYLLLLLAGTALGPVCDELFDKIGYSVLTVESLSGVYGNLLEIPFVAFTKFNNSVVMGSFVSGLVLYIPLYVVSRLLVAFYRKYVAQKIVQTKFVKAMNKFTLVKKIAEKMAED